MKKVISAILALSVAAMLMVGLTGCGEDETTPKNDDVSTSSKDDSAKGKVEL